MNRSSFLMKSLAVTFALTLISSIGYAGEKISCLNNATGAAISFLLVSPGSGYTLYEMNDQMIAILRQQGAQVLGRGVGQLTYSRESGFKFDEYNGYLTVSPRDRGTLVKFERYQSYDRNTVEQANFYFNPGECK